MEFKIPAPLKSEHEALHADLERLIKIGGRTGEAAKTVARLLHSHFIKEEQYALPPLGILSELINGKISQEMKEILPVTQALKSKLPEMLNEHKEIVKALHKLEEIASEENHPEVLAYTEKLLLHAKTEEEVSYPAAILIGEYLKLKLE